MRTARSRTSGENFGDLFIAPSSQVLEPPQNPGRFNTALVKSYGLQQEFITPYSPEQNGMVERVIRTLKDQCVHRHRFETLQHASRVIADWIGFYNHRRPHQALGMKTPAEAYALAA